MSRITSLAFLLLILLVQPGRAWPQEATEAEAGEERAEEATRPFASAFLPAGHWALHALRKLDGLGLAPAGFDRGASPVTRYEAGRLLREAVERARSDAPGYAAMAGGYLDRFEEEFSATAAALDGGVRPGLRLADGAVYGGYEILDGAVRPGSGYYNDSDWSGPVVREDVASVAGGATWSAELYPHAAVDVVPVRSAGEWTIRRGYVTGVWKSVGVWAGRRSFGYGPGQGGGVVLNPEVGFDGGGIYLVEPVTLPWILRYLGPLRFDASISRFDRNGPIDRPLFLAGRVAIAPHPRLDVGINRAIMLGADGRSPLHPKNLVYVAIGKHGLPGTQDNQIMALDAAYRPPLPGLPVVLYLEWGFEDSAGAWSDVPGLLGGVQFPAVPGFPQLGLGVERTSFAESCCGNPKWYRHWAFLDGWTDTGALLGHPLGGHGTEWLAYVHADLLDARVLLTGSFFARDRGVDNLYAPDRVGASTGAGIEARVRALPTLDVIFDGLLESGERDWSTSSAFLGLRLIF